MLVTGRSLPKAASRGVLAAVAPPPLCCCSLTLLFVIQVLEVRTSQQVGKGCALGRVVPSFERSLKPRIPDVAGHRCSHAPRPEQLSEVRRAGPGGLHHVRVQLRSYAPSRLYQVLKLYCSKCCSM